MGVTVSHGCFDGPYSAFNRWRDGVAQVAGYVNIYDSEREAWYYADETNKTLPDTEIKRDVLTVLVYHMDCEGTIEHKYCKPIADQLEKTLEGMKRLSEKIKGVRELSLYKVTEEFIEGLQFADGKGEDVTFW